MKEIINSKQLLGQTVCQECFILLHLAKLQVKQLWQAQNLKVQGIGDSIKNSNKKDKPVSVSLLLIAAWTLPANFKYRWGIISQTIPESLQQTLISRQII